MKWRSAYLIVIPEVRSLIPSSLLECSVQVPIFYCKLRNQIAVQSKGRSSIANSGTKVAVLVWINKCCSFPLHSAPHSLSLSLFSMWTDLKRSEKIPGAPMWRWGEWIWLSGPSGLHRNSPQGLNICSIRVSDQIRDPEIPITLCHQFLVIT